MFRHPRECRRTGISVFDGRMWIYPFAKINSVFNSDPWYSHSHCFYPYGFLFGSSKHSEDNSSEWKQIVIAFPEGKYKGKLRTYDAIWKNRFFTKRIPMIEIKMEEGIPFPGKGENSWDLDESATYGLTIQGTMPEEGISSMVKYVLRNRRKYGTYEKMSNYIPEKKHCLHVTK